jgi:hypothetical protein
MYYIITIIIINNYLFLNYFYFLMFDTVRNVETNILNIVTGLILFICSFLTLIIFLSYKELRKGIYRFIISALFCEVYFGLNNVVTGIYNLFDLHNNENNLTCKLVGAFKAFFIVYWVLSNIAVLFISVYRKLSHRAINKYTKIIIFLISLIFANGLFFTGSTGNSFCDSCFIYKESENFLVILIIIIFFFYFLISIYFNVWFFCLRNKSKDRSFINAQNYYVLVTGSINFIYFLTVLLNNFGGGSSYTLNGITLISYNVNFILMCYFRIQIEYVTIVLKYGPTTSKFINAFLFIFRFYKKPNFRDIKKVLNVKLIDGDMDFDESIYSSIIKTGPII